jgi:hypothetical protein
MAGRLRRALARMTDPSAMSWWRPEGFDPLLSLSDPPATAPATGGARRRDGSSADLRDRQRELAFDMYAEALVRIADADDDAHRRDRRASA